MYRKHFWKCGILGFGGLRISGCALFLADVQSSFQYLPDGVFAEML